MQLGKGSTDMAAPRTEHSREFAFVGAGPKGCRGLSERGKHVISVTDAQGSYPKSYLLELTKIQKN